WRRRRRFVANTVLVKGEHTMIKKNMRRILLAIPALMLAASAQAADEPLKVGFVYVSPIGDAGWTWQQDIGRKQMEEALGAKVKTQYVEDVPEGADAER